MVYKLQPSQDRAWLTSNSSLEVTLQLAIVSHVSTMWHVTCLCRIYQQGYVTIVLLLIFAMVTEEDAVENLPESVKNSNCTTRFRGRGLRNHKRTANSCLQAVNFPSFIIASKLNSTFILYLTFGHLGVL